MGDGYGISGGSGFRDSGLIDALASLVAWQRRSMAGDGWRECRRWRLPGCSAVVSVRGVWHVSSELFLLRSEFVFVHVATRIPGADLSSPGPAAEDFVWLLTRIVLCFAGAGGRSPGTAVAVERESLFGGEAGRGGDCWCGESRRCSGCELQGTGSRSKSV